MIDINIDFDEENYDQHIAALDFDWVDDIRENAGKEFYVIEKTLSDNRGQTIALKSAVAATILSDILIDVTDKKQAHLHHTAFHQIIWNSIRDIHASLYLALSGRYRQANIIERSIIEVAGWGVYFETVADEQEFERWKQGKEEHSNIGKIKSAIRDLDGEIAEGIAEDLGKRWGKMNMAVDTHMGGDIQIVSQSESGAMPLHPWSAYYHFESLFEWYGNIMTDIQNILFFIDKIVGIDDLDHDADLILHYVKELQEGQVEMWDNEEVIQVDQS